MIARPLPSAPWSPNRAATIIAQHRNQRGPLLPILHALQHAFGCIWPQAIPLLAAELNLTTADVSGVVTFYRDFRREPAGRTQLAICRAEACQARGAEALAETARGRFGIGFGETTGDGAVTLDQVFCLGNCSLGPSVRVDGKVIGRVTAPLLDALVDRLSQPVPEPVPSARPDPGEGPGRSGPSGVPNRPKARPVTVHVPADSAARAVGADDVAAAITGEVAARSIEIQLVRYGSRGALWLEPLVEVSRAGVRYAFGPVTAADVPALFDAGFPGDVGDHPLALGPTDEIPWLADQTRLTFARTGVVDPSSPEDYEAHGGLAGLRRALTMSPADIVAEVTDSGLRGRGGAGFPTGIKWKTVLDAPGDLKFICANADEGDSGTFADRMVMEGDPFMLIEGMTIAALATGATEGYVYIRSEYPDAIAAFETALAAARDRAWLGLNILGSGRAFDTFVRVGAGAYICGEETAMLESLEGKRGQVRAKPPLPALQGLFGRPTVVNNVLTLAAVPWILGEGAAAYRELGTGRSRGTQVFQLAGNIARGGIVETAFGVTLGELVHQWGGGTANGRPVRAVQCGGPLGAYLPPDLFDLPMDYEAFTAASALVGHGGIVVFDETVDMVRQARFAMEFCAEESCGKCTPCRVGAVRGVEVIDRIIAGDRRDEHLVLLEDLCELMTAGSLCAMGGLTPLPVRSALRHFGEDFDR